MSLISPLKKLLGLGVLSVLLVSPGARGTAVEPDLAMGIDALLSPLFPADEPGGAVIVVKDGQILLRKGYGMANVELGVAMDPRMIFRIASITKQFTAVAVLMLVEQGRLDLSDSITKYLSDFPTQGKTITIEHLLTHTSGIPSFTELPEWPALQRQDMSRREVIDFFKNRPLEFIPGEGWAYSNSGYVLLGAVIESISGESYENFVDRHIFKPLGMASSSYDNTARIVPLRIPGYEKEGGGYVNAPFVSVTQDPAAGGILSSVDDLAKWNEGLTMGKLLKKETLQKAFTSRRLPSGESTRYGFGWFVFEYDGHPMIEHDGGVSGFSSYALSMPADRVYIAFLLNSRDTAKFPETLGVKIAGLVTGKPYHDPVAISLPVETLDVLTGVYRIDGQLLRVITREGSRLYSQRSGGEKFEIFPLSETECFFKDSFLRLIFVKDQKGRVTEVRLKGRLGPARVAPKTDLPLPREKKAIVLDSAIFDRYVGEYELQPGPTITVSREVTGLFMQFTGEPKLEILPMSEVRFFLKTVDGEVEFGRDASGMTTGLTLYRGDRVLQAKKIK